MIVLVHSLMAIVAAAVAGATICISVADHLPVTDIDAHLMQVFHLSIH